DLNGDGNGGAFPPDRPRRDPTSEASSVGRNSEMMEKQIIVDLRLAKRVKISGGVAVDLIVEGFNLFNRTNFSEINNIFGTGAFPASPLPLSGHYGQALSPRQVLLAAKLRFYTAAAARSTRARKPSRSARVVSPGRPSPIGCPSMRTTGRTSRDTLVTNAS